MSESRRYWTEQALYDLETARAMLEAGRYLYVFFCCQQAIEKTLKALIAERSGELPPRLHHLVRLAEAAGVQLTPQRADFLRELSSYHIQSRYPEESAGLASPADADQASRVLHESEEIVQWLNPTY